MFLCIEKSHWPDLRFPLLRLPHANPLPVFGRSFPWSLLNVSPSVCLTIPHIIPQFPAKIDAGSRFAADFNLRLKTVANEIVFPPKVNTYHLTVTYITLSFFFVEVFQDQSSGHQHHSTTKLSSFRRFPNPGQAL